MILVDSSIWIDHIRRKDAALVRLLANNSVRVHPFILGEVAMGSMANRLVVLPQIAKLLKMDVARDEEVMGFIESQRLFGSGLGYIDAHILVSVRITPGALLWSRDRRLREAAEKLSLAYVPS